MSKHADLSLLCLFCFYFCFWSTSELSFWLPLSLSMTIFTGSTCTGSHSKVFFSFIHFIVTSNVSLNHKSTCFFDHRETTENLLVHSELGHMVQAWNIRIPVLVLVAEQGQEVDIQGQLWKDELVWTNKQTKSLNTKCKQTNKLKKPVWNVPFLCRALSIFTSSSPLQLHAASQSLSLACEIAVAGNKDV